MKLGLIGCGAIGAALVKAIEKMDEIEVIYLYDRSVDVEMKLANVLKKGKVMKSAEDVIKNSDLIIEAASQSAVKEYAFKIADAGKDMLIMSVGALVDDVFRKKLFEKVREKKCRLYIPSGAIVGIDGIGAASSGKIESITLMTIKPPEALKGIKYIEDLGIDLDNIEKAVIVYEGPAEDAVKHFPKNINVAATVSLSGQGFSKTYVRIVADPRTDRNIHKLIVKGDFGVIETEVRNVICPMNPRTSYIAALSAISAIKKIIGHVWIGV